MPTHLASACLSQCLLPAWMVGFWQASMYSKGRMQVGFSGVYEARIHGMEEHWEKTCNLKKQCRVNMCYLMMHTYLMWTLGIMFSYVFQNVLSSTAWIAMVLASQRATAHVNPGPWNRRFNGSWRWFPSPSCNSESRMKKTCSMFRHGYDGRVLSRFIVLWKCFNDSGWLYSLKVTL